MTTDTIVIEETGSTSVVEIMEGEPGSGSGEPGPPGLSAYEVAVQNGFVGTEAQWLASLVGPTGPAGNPGITVSATQPSNPTLNMLWLDISGN